MTEPDHGHYPGYDVLDKRHTLSWDAVTRRVIDQRLATTHEPCFFTADEWRTLDALCQRILPQPNDRPPIPLAALLDAALLENQTQGFRVDPLPHDGQAWKQALAAFDAEAREHFGMPFHELSPEVRDTLLQQAQTGDLSHAAWADMPPELFFAKRILVDVPAMYYSHPTAWSEMGFGGPASPRGYVRMELNRRDPWEPMEAKPGDTARAIAVNRNVG